MGNPSVILLDEHLLLAARHAAAAARRHAAEVREQREQLLRRPVRRAAARRLPPRLEVFRHRQVGEDAPVFRYIAQAETRDSVCFERIYSFLMEVNIPGEKRNKTHH